MPTTTPTAELAAEAHRISRRVHELRHPIRGQVERLVAVLNVLDTLAASNTTTSTACVAWSARIDAAMSQLGELTATARPALEEAAVLLGDLTALVEAEERRRAVDVTEAARRRRIDDEVQRLADEEDAAEQAARRERLEQTARERLAVKASA
jgi:hypothetical protein